MKQIMLYGYFLILGSMIESHFVMYIPDRSLSGWNKEVVYNYCSCFLCMENRIRMYLKYQQEIHALLLFVNTKLRNIRTLNTRRDPIIRLQNSGTLYQDKSETVPLYIGELKQHLNVLYARYIGDFYLI